VSVAFLRYCGSNGCAASSSANAARLHPALHKFWCGTVPGIENADVLHGKSKVFHFGRPPNRVDLLNDIDDVGFPAAWKGRKTERFRHRGELQTVHFIGLEELIRNKRSAGRNKDFDDLRFQIEARRLVPDAHGDSSFVVAAEQPPRRLVSGVQAHWHCCKR
jgi:hypothetical protein